MTNTQILNPYLIYLFVLFFGLIIGSFLNVLIYRIPRNINWWSTRSACPQCKKKIIWYFNIPLLSYIFLKGKCSFCNTKISIKYPIIELIIGVGSSALFYFYLSDSINAFYNSYLINNATPSLLYYDFLVFIFHFTVFCLFVVLFFIDLEFHLLPDGLNLTLAIIVAFYSIAHNTWDHWLIGGLVGFLGPLTITYLFFKMKGQIGLGGGDIKLYGILGMLFGPFVIVQTLCLSSILGLFFALFLMTLKKMQKDQPFAFGPSIIVVAFCQIHFPEIMSYPFTHLLSPI